MKKFNVYLSFELFERVKLMAKKYNKSITKIMVELIEIGYIKMLVNKWYLIINFILEKEGLYVWKNI